MPSTLVVIRPVAKSDLSHLSEISYKTFYDAFFHLNVPEDMHQYMDATFSETNLMAEMDEPESQFYFAVLNEQIVGYIKLNWGKSQTELHDTHAFEIQRIYVLAGHQGKSIGEQLINFAIMQAQEHQSTYIWLGVWEHNLNAIRFYKRLGFSVFDQHDFLLGNDLQTDLLMKKTLR